MSAHDTANDIHARLAMAEAALRSIGQGVSPMVRMLDIAVLIPCCNEGASIGDVVRSFHAALPQARIYVYDNNSHDNSAAIAREAGAVVRREPLQGKGQVVRRMFADIEADAYVLVDGDGSYDAAAAPRLISRLLETQADMVIGARVLADKSGRPQETRIGDRLLETMIAKLYGDRYTDMLSGYRVLSRRFVKSFPALSSGFDTDAELSIHALDLGLITAEAQTAFTPASAPERDAHAIARDTFAKLGMTMRLMRDERPLAFFAAVAALICLGSAVIATPLFLTAVAAGAMAAFPSSFLLGATSVFAGASLAAGFVLESVRLGRREMKRLAFIQQEGLTSKLERLADTRVQLDALRLQALAENPPMPERMRRTRIN